MDQTAIDAVGLADATAGHSLWTLIMQADIVVKTVMFLLLLGGLLIPALFGLVDREISKRRDVFRGRGWAVAALVGVAALYTLRSTEHARAVHLHGAL